MAELLVAAAILAVSLAFLIKGADFLIKGAEEIGLLFGMSPFVIGVLIVGIGTSLPEFAGAIAALLAGTTEIIVANAVGSNIANILIVVGTLAVVAKKVFITRDLMDAELPIFVVSTVLFLAIAFDGVISFLEAGLLSAAFFIYLFYLLSGGGELHGPAADRAEELSERKWPRFGTIALTMVGLVGITVGAKFLIESIVNIATILHINPGLVALTAVAIGTSLPELFVSLKAIKTDKLEIAIGNIFGSNAFNILFTVGIPGLFGTLLIDPQTLALGIPILALASFIFLVSGISRRIYRWEGMLFLVFYLFFLLKLTGLS